MGCRGVGFSVQRVRISSDFTSVFRVRMLSKSGRLRLGGSRVTVARSTTGQVFNERSPVNGHLVLRKDGRRGAITTVMGS